LIDRPFHAGQDLRVRSAALSIEHQSGSDFGFRRHTDPTSTFIAADNRSGAVRPVLVAIVRF
jgi:hypothetical protein